MPRSKNTPPTKLPLSAVTGLAFLTAFLASLVYFFLKPRRKNEPPAPVPEPVVESPVKSVEHIEPSVTSKVQRSWSCTDLSGPCLALLSAYFAQGIYGSTFGEGWMQNWAWLDGISVSNRLWLGSGIYLAALLVWVFTAPVMQTVTGVTGPDGLQKGLYQPFRFYLLFTGFGIYILSIFMFMTGGETGFIRGLWAAGLVCFILSQIPWSGSHWSSQPDVEESPRFRWQEWLVLALILGAAFWLRFYKLASIPDDLHGDMASYGLVARDYLQGVEKNIFGYGFYDIPIMGFLPAIFSMSIFGDNIFGLQMTSLIGGMLSLFAVYLLIWRLFNSHRLAALTVALVAVNVAHIHFSRIAAYMDPWPFGYFALFFLIDGLKSRRASSLGLAGVLLGFCLQMYFSGRVLIFIIGFFLIYAFFFQRSWITHNKRGLALMAAGVRAGDDVLTVANTFIATVEAITLVGAHPVFVEIDPATYNLSPAALEAFIQQECRLGPDGHWVNGKSGRRVTAILPVHLYGLVADMSALLDLARKYNLVVVEDACQAHGASCQVDGKTQRAGSFGRASAFSFYPGKNLGAMGEGGAVTCSDETAVQRMKLWRDHGSSQKYIHISPDGWNGRLDALQCAILDIKLKKLDEWNGRRRQVAAWYQARLGNASRIILPFVPEGWEHIYHLYIIRVPERDRMLKELGARGVSCGLHYPFPLHLQAAYRDLGYVKGDLPVTEEIVSSILTLPMFPHMSEEMVDFTCKSLIELL